MAKCPGTVAPGLPSVCLPLQPEWELETLQRWETAGCNAAFCKPHSSIPWHPWGS